jgi:hypothetical protein
MLVKNAIVKYKVIILSDKSHKYFAQFCETTGNVALAVIQICRQSCSTQFTYM